MIGRRLSEMNEAIRRFIIDKVLHADDPPHKLALGAAIGMFVTFTPTVGAQMALTLFLAWLLRANKVVGLPIVWISNPITLIPIYWSCYLLGTWILGAESKDLYDAFAAEMRSLYENWSIFTMGPALATLGNVFGLIGQMIWPLLVGCTIVSIATAYPTYLAVYYGVKYYRIKRWGQEVPPSAVRIESGEADGDPSAANQPDSGDRPKLGDSAQNEPAQNNSQANAAAAEPARSVEAEPGDGQETPQADSNRSESRESDRQVS